MSTAIDDTDQLEINVALAERDVLKLILEFLDRRQFYISMMNIERETGIINGKFSEDLLFLRQIILDGQWDDVIEFAQPLETMNGFDSRTFHFLVRKFQFLELLCLRTEARSENERAEEQITRFINDLRFYAPNDQEYQQLYLLLPLKNLQDHVDYENWNPTAGRVQCFQEIFPLIDRFLRADKSVEPIAEGDRLMQLVIKGLLYESSIEHCQARASQTNETVDLSNSQTLLTSTTLLPSDVSLLSWLHSLPDQAFKNSFEQKHLSLDIEHYRKPMLDALWSEYVLIRPFKAREIFPFNVTRTGKARSTEMLLRSINRKDPKTEPDVFISAAVAQPTLIDNNLETKPSNSQKPKRVSWSENQLIDDKELKKSREQILKHFDDFDEPEEIPKSILTKLTLR